MINYNNLFVLDNPTFYDKYVDATKDYDDNKYEIFEVFNLQPFNNLDLQKPYFEYRYKSKKLQYMVSGVSFHLIHKDIYDIIIKNNLTGLDFYDVILKDKPKKIENYEYKIFKCLNQSEEYDYLRSEILFIIKPYATNYSLKGMYFKDDIIPDFDFFIGKSTYIFISNKAKLILEKYTDRSIGFIPLIEHEQYVSEPKYYIIKAKLKELIERNEFIYDFLDYRFVSMLFFGFDDMPMYEEAMEVREFKTLWDECNNISDCKNNELIESKFKRYDVSELLIRECSGYNRNSQKDVLNTSKYDVRYVHKMLRGVI